MTSKLRKYSCEGPKTYEVEAKGPTEARLEAAKRYREEIGRKEPISLFIFLFRASVKDPKRPGVKPFTERFKESTELVNSSLGGK